MAASKLTDSQLQQAIADYRDGSTVGQIADHLGIPRTTLRDRFKRANVAMRKQQRAHAELSAAQRDLVQRNHDVVRGFASWWAKNLPPFFDRDEVMADATLGLVEAAATFDPGCGGDFSYFMWQRVRGAMRDGLSRRHDTWGHLPRDRAARETVTISLDSPIRVRGASRTVAEVVADPHDEHELALTRIESDAVAKATHRLPVRLANVLHWRWHEGRSGRQIGRWLGVTESRACQLNTEALARLRDAMR